MNIFAYCIYLFFLAHQLTHCDQTELGSRARSQLFAHERSTIMEMKKPITVHPIIFNYLFLHDAAFAHAFTQRLNTVINIFYQLVSNDICQRAQACLVFTQLCIDDPYDETLQKVITDLMPLYFAHDGAISCISPTQINERNFAIAQFLKNGIDPVYYKKLLILFNFGDVLEYEESTACYITSNVYHMATGGWLPSLTWYPTDIKTLIKEHPHNMLLQELLAYCLDNNVEAAKKFIMTHSIPVCNELFTECFKTYH